jgi:predicted TIM-barrel fold metal-dependent hydrolase
MVAIGTPHEASGYALISADAHVNEPPDLWTSRVPARFRDRVPHIERLEQGDAWIIEGVDDPINFGFNACAGLDPAEARGWVRFEDIRHGGYDALERVAEMDKDSVDAEMLYPTPRLSQGITVNRDPALHLAMVQAYNDWLSEFVEAAPARFGGLAMLPNRGVEQAMAEIDRVWGRPGIRGFVMGCYPNGTLDIEADDDKVWGALAERGTPINIHVSLSQSIPTAHRVPLHGATRFFDAPVRILKLIFAGVFDRFASLSLVVAEVDCGWVPYFREQIDDNYNRLVATSSFTIREAPSAYMDRHVLFTFMNDTFGVDSRHHTGVENIMWSSDYPHNSSNWPTSWRTINATFSGVPAAERHLILAGNAARVYGFSDPERG